MRPFGKHNGTRREYGEGGYIWINGVGDSMRMEYDININDKYLFQNNIHFVYVNKYSYIQTYVYYCNIYGCCCKAAT